MEGEEIVLLEGLGLQPPHRGRLDGSVPSDRQGERRLGFVACQPRGRVQHALQTLPSRQAVGLV